MLGAADLAAAIREAAGSVRLVVPLPRGLSSVEAPEPYEAQEACQDNADADSDSDSDQDPDSAWRVPVRGIPDSAGYSSFRVRG